MGNFEAFLINHTACIRRKVEYLLVERRDIHLLIQTCTYRVGQKVCPRLRDLATAPEGNFFGQLCTDLLKHSHIDHCTNDEPCNLHHTTLTQTHSPRFVLHAKDLDGNEIEINSVRRRRAPSRCDVKVAASTFFFVGPGPLLSASQLAKKWPPSVRPSPKGGERREARPLLGFFGVRTDLRGRPPPPPPLRPLSLPPLPLFLPPFFAFAEDQSNGPSWG